MGTARPASPALSLSLQPRFPRTCGAGPPGARAHKAGRGGAALRAGVPERPSQWPLALERSRAAEGSPSTLGGCVGKTGPERGRRTPGRTRRAFLQPGLEGLPPPWRDPRPRASHEKEGIGDAADSAGNFSLSPYFLAPMAKVLWPHPQKPSSRTSWIVVGPGFSWAPDGINIVSLPSLGQEAGLGRVTLASPCLP